MSNTLNRFASILPLIALLVVFWSVGIYGLDFGAHWDETHAKFDSIQTTLKTGVFMQSVNEPDGYSFNYGGVNYLLTWSGFAPEIVQYFMDGKLTMQALSDIVSPVLYSSKARLRVRAIFLIVSSLAIVWIYCLCVVLGRSRSEAFLAAAILSLSWEVGYHSRWVAPDGVMMQFGALAFLCLALALKNKSMGWLYGGAIVVGLAAGTKYPGVLILPLFLVGAARSLRQQNFSLAGVGKHAVALTATSGFSFLMTTPGAVLTPFSFFAQLKEQQAVYWYGWYGYTVKRGLPHIFEMLRYFALQVFSHYWQVSLVLAVAAVVGILSMFFERRLLTFLMGVFCVVYVVFFARQSAMLVRNQLVIVPFLALASSRGITAIAGALGRKGSRVLYALVAAALFANLGWEAYAAKQIKERGNWEYALRQFNDYARESTRDVFLVSQELLREMKKVPDRLPANVVTDVNSSYTKVAFLQAEGADWYWETWPANRWGMYERTFGALEVNLEAYPTFVGNARVIVMSRKQVDRLPMKVSALVVPRLTLSKTEVVAGTDFYVLKIKDSPGKKVHITYSIDGGLPGIFPVDLEPNGEKRMDVGPGTPKGAYRITAFRRDSETIWHNVDETIVVR